MGQIGSGKDGALAEFLKWTGDILENFRFYHAAWKEFFKDLSFWGKKIPALMMVELVMKSFEEFFMTEEERAKRQREEQKKANEELDKNKKAEEEAKKLQEETYKAASDAMRERARMSEQERENMEKQKEFQEWLSTLNIDEEQRSQLEILNAQLTTQQQYVETMRERIELEREAAEAQVNEEAETRKRAMSQARAGAGPSFGAGSTGEFQFLRDMILNRRERNEELKIMRDQAASLDAIEANTQAQLDALQSESETFVGPVQPVDSF